MKKKSLGQEIIKGLESVLESIKNDTPMQTTTLERMKDGSIKRTVGMKKPSEMRIKK